MVREITSANVRLDPLLVERVRVFYQRLASELRELEAYKKKRGICMRGISCTRKAVKGPRGAIDSCPHHAAARKAGIKLARWTVYESEYGRLRKQQRATEAKTKPVKRKKAA